VAGAGGFFAKAGMLGLVFVGEVPLLTVLKDSELVYRVWL